MILEFIFFVILIFFAFYIPGRFLLRIFHIENYFSISVPLSVALGLSLFLFSTYLLSWIKLDFLYNFAIFLFSILELRKSLVEIKQKAKLKNIPLPEFFLIVAGTIIMSYIMLRSGHIENGSLVFFGVNASDGIYHISLIGSLKNNFPPMHPGILGISLKGYNFFYDFLLAEFSKFYHLNILDLFFRYFTLFFAFIYGLSSFALSKFMKMKRATRVVFLFLIYFAQGFPSFLFSGKILNFNSGIIQPIESMVDPSMIPSISLMFLIFILLFSKRNKFSPLLVSLLIGVLPMIKIYTGFLVFAGVAILFIASLKQKKDFYFLKILIVAGLVAAICYIPINFGSGKLIFAPFLLYRHYLESISAINHSDWFNKLLVYEAHKNYIKIFLFKFILVLPFFYIPSMGLRFANMFFIKKLTKKSFYTPRNLFWISLFIFGILIPSLFIQSVAVFSIIQFVWVSFFILLIPTAYSLTYLLGKQSRIRIVLLVIIVLFLCLPNFSYLLSGYSKNETKIDSGIFDISQKISNLNIGDKVAVLNSTKTKFGYQTVYAVPIVSALSSHSVYFEPEAMEFSGVSEIADYRKKQIGELNGLLISCSKSVELSQKLDNNLRTFKGFYVLGLNKYPCFDKLKNVELIYKNSSSYLYKIL